MEGLLGLIADQILTMMAPVLQGLASLLCSVLCWLASFLRWCFGKLWPALKGSKVLNPTALGRWVRRGVLVAGSLLLIAWGLLEFAFFQAVVRASVARLNEKSGLELSYGSARGFLTTGRIVLSEVAVRRGAEGQDTFDVKLKELEINVRVFSLLGGEVSLEEVALRGPRGRYERMAGSERTPRKPFGVDVLEISDAQLSLVVRRPGEPDFELPVAIDRLETRPFSSENAAFSVLFRSNGTGRLKDAPWSISMEGGDEGRRTTWTADRVPVKLMGAFLGPPLDWMTGGAVDVRVTDRWTRGEKTTVDLTWRFVYRGLVVELPEGLTGLPRHLGNAMAAVAKAHPAELPMEVNVTLDERGLRGRMSVESLELWDRLADGVVEAFAAKAGVPAESVREAGRTGLQKLKGWIERKSREEKR